MNRDIHLYFIPHELNDHRPYILRPHFLSFYSVLVIFSKLFLTVVLFFSYRSPVAFAEITTREILELTNQSRTERGIASVSENPTLSQAAWQKGQDMLDRDYFNHEDPEGNAPWHWLKDNGYLYSYAGENLAMDFVKAESVHSAWMASASHRSNILNPNYQEIGIAVVQGELEGEKTTLLVQFFGTSFASAGEFDSSSLAHQETPFSSETLLDNKEPQLKGEEITVTLKSEKEKNILSYLTFYSKKFYWIFLSLLTLALLINIVVRIKIQHKSVIAQTILVLILITTMLFIKTHFLENISQTLKII